jgi:hypothetical protein
LDNFEDNFWYDFGDKFETIVRWFWDDFRDDLGDFRDDLEANFGANFEANLGLIFGTILLAGFAGGHRGCAEPW